MCVLKNLKYELDRKTLETIYTSYIQPILEYGSPVWNSQDDKDTEFLEATQLEAAQTVSGAVKRTSHNVLFSEPGWKPLKQRRD